MLVLRTQQTAAQAGGEKKTMSTFVERIFPPWKRIPRLLKYPIALFAAFCTLRLSNLLLNHGYGIGLAVEFLAIYLLFWGVGFISLLVGIRRFNRRLIWGKEKPTLRRWYWRHYWLGTFDDRKDD
ncbi:hypothetical protein [Paraburkholderia polaris]|nr:hypothetical protein [Paraburkholderia polaris]